MAYSKKEIKPLKNRGSYYPFGLKHKGYNDVVSANVNSVAKKFKYNGVELEEALGLNLYEMEFRQYDPAIGRFNVIDPLSEFVYAITPYRYAFNNPIFFADPTGLFETRREARQYRRDNNIKGGRIRKQDDGSFALVGKNGMHFQAGDDSGDGAFDIFPNDGVVQSISVVYDKSDAADLKDYQRRKVEFMIKSWEHEQKYGWTPYEWKETRLDAIGGLAEIATLTSAPIIMAVTSKTTSVATEISGDVAVYLSKTANGTIQYVGITNNLAIRGAQHLSAKGIKIESLLEGLSRSDAKAVEQVLIELYGLSKNGGTLINKINSISTSNPIYKGSIKRGKEILKSIIN